MRKIARIWVLIAFGALSAAAHEGSPRLVEPQSLYSPLHQIIHTIEEVELPVRLATRSWVEMKDMETVLAGASGLAVNSGAQLDVLLGGRYLQSMNSIIRGPSRVEFKDFQLFFALEMMLF